MKKFIFILVIPILMGISAPPVDNNLSTQTQQYLQSVYQQLSSSLPSKLGSFSRDLTLANGTQAITGVGFKPSLIIFTGGVKGGTSQFFLGFDNGLNYGEINAFPTGVWDNNFDSNWASLVSVQGAGGDYSLGHIVSLDSDGFTISWAKTGNPTGTIRIMYIAFK